MADETPRADPVRLVVDNAVEIIAAPVDAQSDDGGKKQNAGPPPLPADCPVVPLGMDGDLRHYLDAAGQLVSLPLEKHTRLRLMGLFCERNELVYEYWPRKNEKGNTVGWRPEDAAQQLMGLAAERSLWSPTDKARGRGFWRGSSGALQVNCGSGVLVEGHWRRPGVFGDHVMVARPGVMKPSPVVVRGGAEGVGEDALGLLRAWHWKREIDARLLLGWVGAAFYGASLAWRPLAWIVGSSSTGKSTLQSALKGILGGWLLSVVEPTPASIWQTLKYDCLPVAVDEAEADGDNRRLNELVKLARLCASGGKLIRGGADHEATEFMLRSCVLFSSIRQPPLLPQDRSRIIELRLAELKGERAPDLAPDRLSEMGSRILRRMIDGWSRLPAALEQYRLALQGVGHKGRTIDVFGTALACADIILTDYEVDADSAAVLAAQLDITSLPEAEDNLSDQESWLRHLLSSSIPLDGAGPKNTIAEWLRQASVNDAFDAARQEADRILGNHGIKIIRGRGAGRAEHFAVANRHAALERLHQGTHWAGRSGTIGVWVQAARDLPGASITTQRFAGPPDKGTAIPLELALTPDGEHRSAGASRSLQLDASE